MVDDESGGKLIMSSEKIQILHLPTRTAWVQQIRIRTISANSYIIRRLGDSQWELTSAKYEIWVIWEENFTNLHFINLMMR